jgi:hypothetical protein
MRKYSIFAAALAGLILFALPARADQDEQRGGYSTLSSGKITTGVNPVYHKSHRHHTKKVKVAPKK